MIFGDPVITVENLCKNYGSLKAVQNLSFEVSEGRILGLLGPNGAGKTTTMRILTCFMPPTSGRAQVAGFDIQHQAVEVRRRIGYMPENPPIYPEMDVTAYLRFVAQIKEVPAKEIAERVEAAMAKVNIAHIRGRVIGHLSRGYRQRVGLAQALVHDPKVLVLDEPTLGLDPSQIIEIRELIRSLAGAHTIILSSHILPEVQATCHEIAIIHQGRIVARDTMQSLTQGRALLITLKGADTGAVPGEFGRLPGVTEVSRRVAVEPLSTWLVRFSDESSAEEIFRICAQKNWVIIEMTRQRTSLEEIFLRATGGEDHIAA